MPSKERRSNKQNKHDKKSHNIHRDAYPIILPNADESIQ